MNVINAAQLSNPSVFVIVPFSALNHKIIDSSDAISIHEERTFLPTAMNVILRLPKKNTLEMAEQLAITMTTYFCVCHLGDVCVVLGMYFSIPSSSPFALSELSPL